LIGVYRPTDRNGMVRDHYRDLGFGQVGESSDVETVWTLNVDASVVGAPMRVHRLGFEVAITA
jgi:predicted enzyme involved in methoxymalonyl-ACP biosynthesis